MHSGWLIFLAMVFDGLDGYVARLARTTSDFGAELDSLCDVVSFGVAPGVFDGEDVPASLPLVHDQAIWIIAAAYAACAALRLARFNVETSDDDEHLHFSGLPSPAAAAVIAGFAIMFFKLRQDLRPPTGRTRRHVPAIRVAVLRAVGGVVDGLADSLSARHQSRCCAASGVSATWWPSCSFFVALMVARWYAIPIAASAFALYGPLRLAWEKWVERRNREEPIF